MKGKLTIVLLGLVLVFGMIAASCDDGAYPDNPYWRQTGNDIKSARDWERSKAVPKSTINGSILTTTELMKGLVSGTTYKDGTTGLPATSVLVFVGKSSLTYDGTKLTVVTSADDSWGGGVDIKIGSGAGEYTLYAGDKITVKGASATRDLYIRLDQLDYNHDIKIEKSATFETTLTLSATDIATIANSKARCIRIGCGGDDSYTYTITDIVLARDTYVY